MLRKIKRTVKTDHGDWLFSPGMQSNIPCRLYYEMTNTHIGDSTWPYIVTPYGAWKLSENVLPNTNTKIRFIVYEGMGQPRRSRYKRHERWIEETMQEIREKEKVPEFVVDTLLGDYRDYG
jgi:hypothetical protein